MGYALKLERDYDEIICGACGLSFWVPTHWREDKRQHGTGFYCPNGHSRVYKDSDVDRLKRELAQAQSALEFQKSRGVTLERRLKQEAGKHKALKRRVAHGVCPCCQRTFTNMARHMKTKHPEYQAEGAPAKKAE